MQYEMKEICEVIEKEKEAARTTGFLSFFETKGNRHRLLICVSIGFMIQWAGNGTHQLDHTVMKRRSVLI